MYIIICLKDKSVISKYRVITNFPDELVDEAKTCLIEDGLIRSEELAKVSFKILDR